MTSILESTQVVLDGSTDTETLRAAIRYHLNEQTVISLDSLICLMPQYTWNQIFQGVDQLARSNELVLRRHRFEYLIFSSHFAA